MNQQTPTPPEAGLTTIGRRFAENRASFACAEGKLTTLAEEAVVYGLINAAGTAQNADGLARAARVADGHVVYIEAPDSRGHFEWHCVKNDADGSGYELAAEVSEAATAHAPLAADSYIPRDEDTEE